MQDVAPRRGRPKRHYETVEDMCDYLHVARSTLYRYMDQLGLPYVHLGAGRRFDRKKVDAWVTDRDGRIKAGTDNGVAWLEENGEA
jgi:excisionase family DNA binding protein